jgi:tetratricopeptide (TPR) repeat protein
MALRWTEQAQSAESYQYLGSAAFALGRLDEAVTHYKQSRDLSPSKEWGTIALAKAYVQAGQMDAAIAELWSVINGEVENEKAGKKARQQAFGDLVAKLLPGLGRFHEGLRLIDAGIDTLSAQADSSALVQALIAKSSILYWGWRDVDGVTEQFRIIDGYPDKYKHEDYWLSLAVYKILGGEVDEGMELVRKYNKEPMAIPFFESVAASEIGDCDGAVALMDSIKGVPENNTVAVRFRAAVCYYDAGRFGDAAKQLKRILSVPLADYEIGLEKALSTYYCGKSLEAAGDAAEALAYYETFLKIWSEADEDQPFLIDARDRVAVLKAAGSM